MLNVVFSDSALGSLKVAQSCREGGVIGGATSVILLREDGNPGTPEELERAVREYEERERRAWEKAVPMDGSPGDSYGFSLGLSQGAIPQGADIWEDRRQMLGRQFSIYPNGGEVMEELISRGKETTDTLLRRIEAGEPARIWYSDEPEERSGLCWFMSLLTRLPSHGEVWLVKLPGWEAGEEPGTLVRHDSGWGEIEPARWGRYLPLGEQAEEVLCKALAREWEETQEAPLRAVINGRLRGVGEDFYDPWILDTLEKAPEEFHQARLIGEILGRHRLGISDAWVALRMEEMIRQGMLEPASQPPEDGPVYHRWLRKRERL